MTDKPDDLEDGLKHNPWSVETVEQFLYYNCPECDNKTQSKTIFINHAYLNHPRVSFFFSFFFLFFSFFINHAYLNHPRVSKNK